MCYFSGKIIITTYIYDIICCKICDIAITFDANRNNSRAIIPFPGAILKVKY